MPLTSDQLAVARSWVGDVATSGELDARYDRLYDVAGDEEVALDQMVEEELRYRLAVLTVGQPAGLSLPDGTRIDQSANIVALRERLRDFVSSGQDSSGLGPGIARMVRPSGR